MRHVGAFAVSSVTLPGMRLGQKRFRCSAPNVASFRQYCSVNVPGRGYNLAHPVYLDVPMMTSFLAHLEGGVAVHEEATERESGARERALKGRAGLRLRLFPLGDGEVGIEGSQQRRDETSFEYRTERHHTAASLFNILYDYLQEDEQVISLSLASQLAELHSGELIELAGEYLGNPLEEVLAFFATILPYIEAQEEVEKSALEAAAKKAKGSHRSGSPAKRAAAPAAEQEAAAALTVLQESLENRDREFGARMVLRMGEDISVAPVHDLLFRTSEGLAAVVTVSSEFSSRTTNEYLRAGGFRVVGKVTRVVNEGDSINLTRRTVLGAAGPAVAQQIVGSVQGTDVQLDVANPIVEGPAVQILPMAIFI